jgi:hypothetical protein
MKNLMIRLALVAAVLICVGACEKSNESKGGTPTPTPTPSTPSTASPKAETTKVEAKGEHAAPDVVPGSHEDWCEEHAVPESQCTRCNPDLIAAFKATNDWCEEHGLPESQCTKCNPELVITRPPAKP